MAKHKLNSRVFYLGAEWTITKIYKDNMLLKSQCNQFTTTVKPQHYKHMHKAQPTQKRKYQAVEWDYE